MSQQSGIPTNKSPPKVLDLAAELRAKLAQIYFNNNTKQFSKKNSVSTPRSSIESSVSEEDFESDPEYINQNEEIVTPKPKNRSNYDFPMLKPMAARSPTHIEADDDNEEIYVQPVCTCPIAYFCFK